MENISELFDRWPTRSAIAADLGLTQQAVGNMAARNSIAGKHWKALVSSAGRHGITGVTFADLAAFHENKSSEAA